MQQRDVFISHSSKDKNVADSACAVLESNGLKCWVAPRDILPGVEWGEAILSGIEASRVMLLIFSRYSNESAQVRREVERAVAKGLTIIPLRIDDVLPSKAMEYFISVAHWLDAITPPLETHLVGLANTILHIIGRPSKMTPLSATKSAIRPKKKGLLRRPLLAAGILTAIALGVGGYFWRSGRTRVATPSEGNAREPMAQNEIAYSVGFEPPLFTPGPFREIVGSAPADAHWHPWDEDAVQIENTVVRSGTQALMIDVAHAKPVQTGVSLEIENSCPFVTIQGDIFFQSSTKQTNWQFAVIDPEASENGYVGGFNVYGETGGLQIVTAGWPQNLARIQRGVWTHFEIRMDVRAQTFDLLLNGSAVAKKIQFLGRTSKIRRFDFATFGNGNDRAYLDNFSFVATAKPRG